jgi:hypothetical protein
MRRAARGFAGGRRHSSRGAREALSLAPPWHTGCCTLACGRQGQQSGEENNPHGAVSTLDACTRSRYISSVRKHRKADALPLPTIAWRAIGDSQ